ncbi:hypothetical protein GQR58_008201 [Nymphon striatum]|nr:hypothetical protein GQR58_008201 [Nymphon striatum]
MSSGTLPNGLKTFLGVLVKSVLKQQSIGQSIVFAARPRSVIPPIMFGLGVELDHVFGFKWLIEELSHLGFSVSYQEVTRFKQSAMATEDASQISTKFPPGTFTQYVADNVDHNLCTLDGKDTFHGMGIIQSFTNKSGLQRQSQTIKREFLKPVSQVTKDKGIPLSNIDLLWQTSYFFKQQNRPSWSGFMQTFRSGDYPGQSEINLLPIINLNPSDMTCIYSTLLFVIDQCKKNNSGPACITFDQQLWIKELRLQVLKVLTDSLAKKMEDMATHSRTSKLWIQYIKYVDIIKMFVTAERTGKWQDHLEAVRKMLNLFAPTGHIHYAKSARLYLQVMLDLPSTFPDLHHKFTEEYHVVRRSDRFWGGLWTDLVIEQVMVRSLKSRGGLTRRRGMAENVTLTWVHTMHTCAQIHHSMTTCSVQLQGFYQKLMQYESLHVQKA